MTSARLIVEARRRAGLTQAGLAARLGTTQSAVARWEKAKATPSLERLTEVVRACGLDLHVSLTRRDHDHDQLISEYLTLTPRERLSDLAQRLEVERSLRGAVRTR